MFNDANMDADKRTQLAKECLSLANKYCNLSVSEYQDKKMTRYEAAGLELPPWTKNLWEFGDAGVVKIDKNGKLGDRGATCIFVNYPKKHNINYRIKTNGLSW